MPNRDSLKLYEVDVFPAVSADSDKLQRFTVGAYSTIEAHMLAIQSICLGFPSTSHVDWIVKAVRIVKNYQL